MKSLRFLRMAVLTFCTFAFVLMPSCQDKEPGIESRASDFSSQVVQDYMSLMGVLSKETTGAFPPVVARAYAYTGLALYESLVPGMPDNNSFAGLISGFSADMIPDAEAGEYHWGVVANAVLAQMLRDCFSGATPENLAAIDALEVDYRDNIFAAEADAEVMSRSEAHGKAVALAILAYADADGEANCFNTNFPTSYVAPVGPGMWRPTPPLFALALQPYWGDVRPFLNRNISEEMPPPPPSYSTTPGTEFMDEVMEVYNTVLNLTDEQRIIAHYWSDDPGKSATPAGHSLSILRQVLDLEDANLAEAAESFALMTMAVHDAFISCWESKYIYNLVRPITVIQTEIDGAFTIPLPTPPFPEYTSGHSVQSGAAAKVLTEIFGENYAFTDYTQVNRPDINGDPRSFASFYAFADEAARSRLYGGIHFRSAIDEGIAQGLGVGENIMALPYRK
ncbi:MAG: phosphatase PAP2 family protein [Bacteroidetes bacterium]|nr:phosphatase PAP2 family protein [Bacteroidota bacterium]